MSRPVWILESLSLKEDCCQFASTFEALCSVSQCQVFYSLGKYLVELWDMEWKSSAKSGRISRISVQRGVSKCFSLLLNLHSFLFGWGLCLCSLSKKDFLGPFCVWIFKTFLHCITAAETLRRVSLINWNKLGGVVRLGWRYVMKYFALLKYKCIHVLLVMVQNHFLIGGCKR